MIITGFICIFCANGESEDVSLPAERIGPPTFYSPDVERYRFQMDVSNPLFYPIPNDEVKRDSYMKWLEDSGLLKYAEKPEQGLEGPIKLMPVLAKYIQTGEAKWGQACISMLEDFYRGLQDEVKSKGWTERFIEEPSFIPIYRKYLIEGGLMSQDEAWFREMWLYYARNLHVWGSEPIEWRGACHRSLPEGLMKGLAALWYPDIPEASHWNHYSELVFGDFWEHKDFAQNDTGYFPGTLLAFMCAGDQLLGDDRFITDSGMQNIWERIASEITPDGSINPYGPNGGWNSTAAFRIFALELVASKMKDDTFRFPAHKAMNYLRYQADAMRWHSAMWEREVSQNIALAYIFADDTIKPIKPEYDSKITQRIEMARIPHDDKTITGKYLKELDPDPIKAHVCCGWAFTGNIMPDKLVLRSGWEPGDFFALVDLFPRSFPFNSGGIMGMNRWGAPFTQISSSKGHTPENRLIVIDTSGKAKMRYISDPDRIDEDWRRGKMPDITTEVKSFQDTEKVTFAHIQVNNFDGLPVKYEREFVFIKNRFLVTREIATFEEGFPAQVGPIWNTQNIGPQIGSNWANTFISAPVGWNGEISMKTPPVDLLVYFAPQPDCKLQVVDRTVDDPRTTACAGQVRYIWEGTTMPSQQLLFTQVYYPHRPFRFRANTNNPGAKAVYSGGDFEATACASGIEVIRDTVETTVMKFAFEPDRVEWVVFNPKGNSISEGSIETDASYAYIDLVKGEVISLSATNATFISLDDRELFRQQTRGIIRLQE